jgi:hypothetical protein
VENWYDSLLVVVWCEERLDGGGGVGRGYMREFQILFVLMEVYEGVGGGGVLYLYLLDVKSV